MFLYDPNTFFILTKIFLISILGYKMWGDTEFLIKQNIRVIKPDFGCKNPMNAKKVCCNHL